MTETELSEEFQISRGTIRGALRLLVSDRLVIQVLYRGWEVAALTSVDAYELQTLRSSMESLAARLAAKRLTPCGRTSLSQAFRKLERACKANDGYAAALGDFELHRTIVEISGPCRLTEYYQHIAVQVQRYIFSSDALLRSDMELLDQHRPIVEAKLAQDGDKAPGRRKITTTAKASGWSTTWLLWKRAAVERPY